MSLQHAAKYLANQGRGKDTMLVHMTPSEVGGLQAIAKAHGGSLSINPHTGLPEASFLSNIMPMVIGAGLAAATGGTSLALTPGMVGLGVGGLEALRTGDIKKGLVAGLGAYGGAGLAGGLAGAGAAEIGKSATEAAVKDATAQGLTGASYNQAVQQSVMDKMAGNTFMGNVGAGLSNPSTAIDAMGGGLNAAKYGITAATPFLQTEPVAPAQADSGPNPYRYRFDRGEASPFPQPSSSGVEQSYFPGSKYVPYADGGMANSNVFGVNTGFQMSGGQPSGIPYQQSVPQSPAPGLNPSMYDPSTGAQRLASGGLSDLGGYSDGGRLLRGPGDGVSDSIPAMIGEKQPARLADGEFVVPARIVSELGNGSTEAGARKLYAMMDRVQKARSKSVGKGNVAKNTRAEKHLPA